MQSTKVQPVKLYRRWYGVVYDRPSGDGHTINVYRTHGGYEQLVVMKHCLCEDGRSRLVHVGEADTYFSCLAHTHARGKSISGYVSFDDERGRWSFKARGKYRDLLSGPRVD